MSVMMAAVLGMGCLSAGESFGIERDEEIREHGVGVAWAFGHVGGFVGERCERGRSKIFASIFAKLRVVGDGFGRRHDLLRTER